MCGCESPESVWEHAVRKGQRQEAQDQAEQSLGGSEEDGRTSRVDSNGDVVLSQFGHQELVG